MNPLLLVDSYKIHHTRMYPAGMTKLYSNMTPRKSRIPGIDAVVVFAVRHFIQEYLIDGFDREFFQKPKKDIIEEYKRHCPVNTDHIEALWDLGYLPLEIKALDEGTLCPIGVPLLTITNTHPAFGWLVNYVETLMSCCLWQAITSATIAHQYKKILTQYAKETDKDNVAFVDWQGHDFSMRGMSSPESTILSGMGHLLSFTGTDTIPAIYQLEKSYDAEGLIGASVPATEHSVMCMGTKESEIETFKRLLNLYPTGILSVVSDTWDLWKVCTEYLPEIKDQILARDGKLVIRPDSGDPVNIICGTKIVDISDIYGNFGKTHLEPAYKDGIKYCKDGNKIYKILLENSEGKITYGIDRNESCNQLPEVKGVIELLWDIFGGTVNEQGYKVLDSHIGAIYGDSITLERAKQICERLKAKGFASTNIVLGIGSYTYQYNTRDTFGFAIKATYGEVLEDLNDYDGEADNNGLPHMVPVGREIFKDPITDDGTKKSKKGLLKVIKTGPDSQVNCIQCFDQQTWEKEKTGLLTTAFYDGVLIKKPTLTEIRKKLNQ